MNLHPAALLLLSPLAAAQITLETNTLYGVSHSPNQLIEFNSLGQVVQTTPLTLPGNVTCVEIVDEQLWVVSDSDGLIRVDLNTGGVMIALGFENHGIRALGSFNGGLAYMKWGFGQVHTIDLDGHGTGTIVPPGNFLSTGLTFNSTEFHLAEEFGQSVQTFDHIGQPTGTFLTLGTPSGLAYEESTDSVWVTMKNSDILRQLSSTGQPMQEASTGILNMTGLTMVNQACEEISDVYPCAPSPNSTGSIGELEACGSSAAADNNVTLNAWNLPVGEMSMFLNADMPGLVSNPGGSAGMLCLGGGIGRHRSQIGPVAADGTRSILLDLTALPRPTGQPPITVVQPGETWFFQCWHRDGATSNFTRAVMVNFN